jgi:hypothetical protein
MAFVNLHYIRAAIEEKTGRKLSLKRVRQLLVEENLITKKQSENIQPFNYREYYEDAYQNHDLFPREEFGYVEEDPLDLQQEANLYVKIEKGSR